MKEYRVESDLCNPRCFVIQASTPRRAALLGLKQNNSLKGNFETDYELLK